ncbi:hypothetical protein [Streptomyces sp. NPDC001480]|uniref:hypothetical protein n=1 Tax=Streptomyces sp. NPDC001480 TaxID=3364577 RepID=UPI0036865DD8
MARHKQVAPRLAVVLAAVKGGVGDFRESPQGRRYKDDERRPALERPTLRPDIRAAVISKTRVNMHRKMRPVLLPLCCASLAFPQVTVQVWAWSGC